ncbi:transposase [Mesorhizobium sp. LNHC252B00]|uniref:transposase n=1 Tax=Mesorhizobium sp. LNHC252B00 TaxID=1287252 RepID=UPI000A005509|nr:transposase [Mesorhizobium sp. LNHC252B00]
MQAECILERFDFAPVERRAVVAGFDGGTITSDAGALLLGLTDRAIGLVGRFARCFVDARRPALIEHEVKTLVGQRIFALALGYEDFCALRRIGLVDTRLAKASCATIRLKLFKIGALVSVSVRRIKLAMNSACPFQRPNS